MKKVDVGDKSFVLKYSHNKLMRRISAMAEEINSLEKDKDIVFMIVLNGAYMFASDLTKKITLPCEVTFVKVASYSGTKSTGNLKTLVGINTELKNKTIILIEDIVDSGNTLENFIPQLELHSPKEIKICSLFFKPNSYKGKRQINYIGFSIDDSFIVGYGLDYNEKGRNLPAIYELEDQ